MENKMASIRSSLKAVYMAGVLIALNAVSPMALAMTKPADANGFGHFVYDIAVNKIAQGPIGFVGAMFTIVYSAIHITKNWMLSVLGIIGGTVLIKADKIVESMGALLG
jgi:hypothetical protein